MTVHSLEKAKFKVTKGSHPDNLSVAKHKALGKYLLKLYTDDQVNIDEVAALTKRIEGAALIRQIINTHRLHDVVKVPKKWLYPLPHPAENGKRFLLVVEDMKLVSSKQNLLMWKSNTVSKDHLAALHLVLVEAGLYDSVYLDNIPFSKDGKIAFIDTEHFHRWPIRFGHISRNLSKNNRIYWESL